MGDAILIRILNKKIFSLWDRIDGMHPGADKPNTIFIPGLVEVQLVVFTKGPHVHVEDGCIQGIVAVFFGDDGFLDRIHTAYGRAVTVVTPVQIPGAHALEPGDFFRFFLIRWPFEVPKIGAC